MKKGLLLCFALMLSFFAIEAFGQGTVSGTVYDETGEPLPGVTIQVKGSTDGTATDINGKYSLNVPNGTVLVFSGVGLKPQEYVVGSETTINITMDSDVKSLDQVVVVGYGEQQKKYVTGAVTTVEGDKISTLATAGFDQQLAGRSAGLNVTMPTGILGQAPRIRIRGTNTISSNADPLIVIDGVPTFTGNLTQGTTVGNPLADLNPADIESYEVLKDGAATAIYGSRAANGVILITTKKGTIGKSKLSYDVWFGWTNASKRFDLLNAEEFITISNEKLANQGDAPAFFPLVDTDWQDVIFRTGFQQSHNLSLSGGTEKTSYYFSAGWTEQTGFIVSNKFRRGSFRGNVDQKVNDWLKVGIKGSFVRTENIGLNTGRNSLSGNITNATKLFPNVPVRDPSNPTGFNTQGQALGQGNNTQGIDFNYPNIGFVLANNLNNASNYRIIGSIYGEVLIPNVEGLSLKTQYAVDGFFNEDFTSWDSRHGDGFGSNGLILQGNTQYLRWNWQNTLNFNRDFGDHNIGFVAGIEYQKDFNKFFSATVNDLADNFFRSDNIVSGSFSTPAAAGGATESGFDSYFGRINYAYADKYLASFSIRNDAISALPIGKQRGTFLGGSVGWRISEEVFFQDSFLGDFISEFKLRASYAQVGNTQLGNSVLTTSVVYPAVGTFGVSQYASQGGIAFNRLGNVGNPNLQWEVSNKLNIGFDMGLLDNRITLGFDYYKNDVSDLILAAPAALSLGVPGNTINQNIGGIVNSGIEIEIFASVLETPSGFNWNTSFNFSTNRNEVTALSNNNSDIIDTYNITRVGEPIGSIYGFIFEGVNSVNGNPIFRKADGSFVQYHYPNGASGTYVVYDPNSPAEVATPATLSAEDDRVLLGNPNPTWFGGWSNSFAFKGFDLEIFLRFSGGNKIMNVTRQELLTNANLNNSTEILDRWTAPGQQTNVPRLGGGSLDARVNNTGFADSRFVENGDFLRIQNIVLGYTLPSRLLSGIGLQKVRFYTQIQNAFVFTQYKGLDPEINSNPTLNREFGIDFNGNPVGRTFTFGLNVTF